MSCLLYFIVVAKRCYMLILPIKIYPIISYHLYHLIPSVALSIPESLQTVFNEVLGYRFKHKAKKQHTLVLPSSIRLFEEISNSIVSYKRV